MQNQAVAYREELRVSLEHSQGALVRADQGRDFIDYDCGAGANTLGHNHPAVADVLRSRRVRSLPAELEQATRELIRVIPGAELANFFATEARMREAAVRLARHLHGKQELLYAGGACAEESVVDEVTLHVPLTHEGHEEALLARIAERGAETAMLLLALPHNRVISTRFLHALRDQCRQHKVSFVLDERVSGFRLALGGAQEFYELDADFVCLSNGLAGGLPLAAIAGKRAHMARMHDLFASTTFDGDALSLAVCKSVLRVYQDTDYLEHQATLGRRLARGINTNAARAGHPLRVVGYDAFPFFQFAIDVREQARMSEAFVAAMARRGVLLRGDLSFLCSAHTEAQIDSTIAATDDALRELASQAVF